MVPLVTNWLLKRLCIRCFRPWPPNTPPAAGCSTVAWAVCGAGGPSGCDRPSTGFKVPAPTKPEGAATAAAGCATAAAGCATGAGAVGVVAAPHGVSCSQWGSSACNACTPLADE